MIIGLAGNIGSGKSMAAAMLAEFGASVIHADAVGHAVLEPGGAAYQAVCDAFGSEFVAADGTILRKQLAAHVFSDRSGQRQQQLNALTHPAIHRQILTQLEALVAAGAAVVVVEAALLFDSSLHTLTDENWLILADKEQLIQRAMARDDSSREAVLHRLSSQRPAEELAVQADRVFYNTGTPEQLRLQLRAAYLQICPQPDCEQQR